MSTESAAPSIAILCPLADYGINTYSFELAEGLAAHGVEVTVYTNDASVERDLPEPVSHRRLAVLGSALYKQSPVRFSDGPAAEGTGQRAGVEPTPAPRRAPRLRGLLREAFLSVELVLHLKKQKYDIVWTQWPDMSPYSINPWALGRLLGLHLVHTVHNILPHEPTAADERACGRVYRSSELLFVHSNSASAELRDRFRLPAKKVCVTPHGTYTSYPRRPGARERVRAKWGIGEHETVLLFCGAIRPYKNPDAVLGAMADPACDGTVLVVAGREAHFADGSADDPLGRTRRMAAAAGLADRVKLIPRMLDRTEMADLMEAGDIMVLPYLKSYGSGMLMLGMTFGKHIVATATGGMDEHLRGYGRYTLLASPGRESVRDGIAAALRSRGSDGAPSPELEWRNIAAKALKEMNTRLWEA